MKIAEINLKFLEEEFQKIQNLDPKPRGRALQTYVKHIATFNGINTLQTESPTAFEDKPDLHIYWERNIFVECKWEARLTKLGQILKFISQLRYRDPMTIGLFLSMSGFTEPVINSLKLNPDRAIILMNRQELEIISNGSFDFEELIKLKINKLQRGEIYFLESVPTDEPIPFNLDVSLAKVYPHIESYPETNGIYGKLIGTGLKHFNCLTFLMYPFQFELPLVNWNFSFQGFRGSSLEFSRRVMTALKEFHNLYGFSETTTFGITQNKIKWFGFGINNFINCIQRIGDRYESFIKIKEKNDIT
ncbi:MAG: hypothetical protein ACTSVV_10420 [Promethearchaeota archaeon]